MNWSRFLAKTDILELKGGDILYVPGELASKAFFVLDGNLVHLRFPAAIPTFSNFTENLIEAKSATGVSKWTSFQTGSNTFSGLRELLMGQVHRQFCISCDKTKVASISKSQLSSLLQDDSNWRTTILRDMCNELSRIGLPFE